MATKKKAVQKTNKVKLEEFEELIKVSESTENILTSFEGPVKNALKVLKKAVLELETAEKDKKYKKVAVGWDGLLFGYRTETEAEAKKRLQEEEKDAKERESWEKEEYLRLKAKFGAEE